MNIQNTNYNNFVNNDNILPISAFSAYSLLRNCNYLMNSQIQDSSSKKTQDIEFHSPNVPQDGFTTTFDTNKTIFNIPTTKSFINSQQLFAYPGQSPLTAHPRIISPCSFNNSSFRRQRGEKKPIPDEQKDDKYFERRRRNNQAAKKSRDARKMREDQIALRATILEHENAILRAQVLTLREEASNLRQMLLQKKTLELAQNDTPICIT